MNQHSFTDLLITICNDHDIHFESYSDDWVIKINNGTQTHWIVGQNFDLNTQANAALATDKVAASKILNDRGASCVPHYLLPRFSEELSKVDQLQNELRSGDVVMKPLTGASGANVTRVKNIDMAQQLIVKTPHIVWAYSPWRDIKSETRLVIVDGVIEVALTKYDPVEMNGLKMFNLSKGASAKSLKGQHIPEIMTSLALKAMDTLGLRMAAVDVIEHNDGTLEILEVNAVFSLMRFSKINDATYSEVASFYDRLVKTLFTE